VADARDFLDQQVDCFGGSVAVFAVALYVSTPGVVRLVGFGAIAVIFALALYSAIVAGRAAKKAGGYPDNRQRQ
jgi:multisubunit Na+/H+ antiporter MnhG subunit